MFVTPLVVDDDNDRRAIMTQAVGRASRFGQEREVGVWQYAADGVELTLLRGGGGRKRR